MNVIDNYTRNTIIFGDLSWNYSTSVLVPAKTIGIVVDQSKFINHSSQQHTTWMSLFPYVSELIQYEYDAIIENIDISKINQKTSKDYITSLLMKKIEMLSNERNKTHPESETMKAVTESFEIYTEDDLLPDILMNFGNSSLDDHHHNEKEQEIIANNNNNNNIFSDPFKKGKILGAIDWTQYFYMTQYFNSSTLDFKGRSVYTKFKEGHKYGKLLENLDQKKTKIYLSELLDKIQEILATDPIQDRNLDIIILQKNFERCVYQPGKNIVFGNPLSIKPSKKDLYKNCLKKYACPEQPSTDS